MKSYLVLASAIACWNAAAVPHPGPTLFAEGVVSTPDDEFGFALAPDGRTTFFGKSSPSTAGDPMQVFA